MCATTHICSITIFYFFILTSGASSTAGPESSTAIPVGKIVKAVWNGIILAESDNAIKFDNNIYFPPNSINMDYLEHSPTHTTCPWKGVASYMTINADREKYVDGVWYFPAPKEAAKNITGYFAFSPNVKIVDVE